MWSFYINVVTHSADTFSPKVAVHKLVMKTAGERDYMNMGSNTSLKIHRSSFQILTVSLDNNRKCCFSWYGVQEEKSHLNIYAETVKCGKHLLTYSFIDFHANFELKKDVIATRKTPIDC